MKNSVSSVSSCSKVLLLIFRGFTRSLMYLPCSEAPHESRPGSARNRRFRPHQTNCGTPNTSTSPPHRLRHWGRPLPADGRRWKQIKQCASLRWDGQGRVPAGRDCPPSGIGRGSCVAMPSSGGQGTARPTIQNCRITSRGTFPFRICVNLRQSAVNSEFGCGWSRRNMRFRQAQRRRRVALGATPPPLAVASWHQIPPQNRRAVVLAVRFCSFYRAALRPIIFHSPASMNETGGQELASSGRVNRIVTE